ncbi:MAG TPA: protein kinase [Thermoanaerobaculia bacterium]|nr:protein kinase [Thermoanaerobaculia bacterium]
MNLGRYEVVRELGKGAMGIVYLAKDPLIGRLVALKTIRLIPNSDDEETREFQQRFIREAQAAGILSHPCIVTVHDIGQDEESSISFIAMEYVEGPNLKEVLQQGKPIDFNEIGEIVAQVAEALDFAHAKGIVHRDVKPANIILSGPSKIKITDFGIAKIASGVSNLTSTGQFLGTPNYMAPEQIKGTPVDGRTDLFSLGIVFYECLTRRKPFGGDSLTSISYKIVHEPFLPLREVNPDIPAGFEAIVAKCLAKEPANRFQRGKDIAEAIRAVLKGEPVVAPEPFLRADTLIARDPEERILTIELPFPEAAPAAVAARNASSSQSGSSTRKAVKAMATTGSGMLRSTLSRAIPREGLKTRLKAPVFFGIIAAFGLLVVLTLVSLHRLRVYVPAVDGHRESAVQQEKQLRLDAEALLKAGNVEGAYAKYKELQKRAPNSLWVRERVLKLERIRFADMSKKQRLDEAAGKLQQGKDLYDQKKYAEAILMFEEAFHLNPSLDEAVNYLRMTREQLSMEQFRGQKQPALGSRPGAGAPPAQDAPKLLTRPSGLQTFFKSPIADGYIVVKMNGDSLLKENLWEERRGSGRQRHPRSIDVYTEIAPQTADLDVWVVIPTLQINEHRVVRKAFLAGVVHKLVVTLDAPTRHIEFQLS